MKDRNISEDYHIQMALYGENIDLTINSDYNSFRDKICSIMNIPSDYFQFLSISYIDEDGDNIVLSLQEDYEIFFNLIKDNAIEKKIMIDFNENSKIDQINCLSSALNYQGQHAKEYLDDINNNKKDDNNKMNNNIKNNNNNQLKKNEENNINNNNNNNNNQHEEEDLENYIYNYKCSNCEMSPIIFVMYYCPKCSYYLCEECYNKLNKKHQHPLIKIVTQAQLFEIKEKENEEIEKRNRIRENNDMINNNNMNNNNNNINNNNMNNNMNNNNNYDPNNNNNRNNINNIYYNNNINYNHNIINGNNDNVRRTYAYNYNPDLGQQGLMLYDFTKNILKSYAKDIKEEGKKIIKKYGEAIDERIKKDIELLKLAQEARRTYNLVGVNDFKLMNAIKGAGGNIHEAVLLLTK
jgi:hypothetical protein